MSDTETHRINARWTNDCQGKKDFDGVIVDISTRYWPQGGGFSIVSDGEFRESKDFLPHVKPSAKSHIRLLRKSRWEDDDEGDGQDLISAEFEADTEDEVRAQVEEWAAGQYARIVRALESTFA